MTQTIFPVLRYEDAPGAIEWLTQVLGFGTKSVAEGEPGQIAHAELTLGSGMVMLATAKAATAQTAEGNAAESTYAAAAPRPGGAMLYLVVADPDAHYERATAAGADVVMGLTDMPYGSREFTVRDPAGNLWTMGTYNPAAS